RSGSVVRRDLHATLCFCSTRCVPGSLCPRFFAVSSCRDGGVSDFVVIVYEDLLWLFIKCEWSIFTFDIEHFYGLPELNVFRADKVFSYIFLKYGWT
ncbi:unnamed protein product, partial [Acanthoscelides obtectus]